MLQVREAEERSDRRATRSHLYGAVAHLDFLLGQFDILRIRISRQILVRPGVGADRHPGFDYLLGDFGVPHCVLADLEECGLQTFVGQRLEDGGRVLWPGAVVERQNDLLIAEEVVLFEVFEAETGTTCRVDLNDARKAHPPGAVACRNGTDRADRRICVCARRWGADRTAGQAAILIGWQLPRNLGLRGRYAPGASALLSFEKRSLGETLAFGALCVATNPRAERPKANNAAITIRATRIAPTTSDSALGN